MSAVWKGLGMGSTRKKKPSMRYLTEIASSLGSICTSEAPLRAARARTYWMMASGSLCSHTGLAA